MLTDINAVTARAVQHTIDVNNMLADLVAGSTPDYRKTFRVGVYDFSTGDGTQYETDLPKNYLSFVILQNTGATDSKYDELDRGGIPYVAGPMVELGAQWWNANVNPTLANALTVATPLVNAMKGHPGLVGYLLCDDVQPTWDVKAQMMTRAFEQLDPTRPAMPCIVAGPSLAVYDLAKPKVHLTYWYPCLQGTADGDLRNGGVDYPQACRDIFSRALADDVPIWFGLQANQTTTGGAGTLLRYPSIYEMDLLFWIAIGEGAKSLAWFTHGNTAQWVGLGASPTRFAKAKELSQRLTPTLRTWLLGAHPVTGVYSATCSPHASYANPYVGLLQHTDGSRKIVLSNREWQPSILTLSGTAANLVDESTNEPFAVGSGIWMAGGATRMLRVV